MNTKKYLYAAVGAQVAVAKSAQARIEDLMAKLNENASSASSDFKTRVDTWAGEGEQFLGKVTDTKAIDELTARVDFDQVQTQVNKLRDQLEDIVSTWRANFRPEGKVPEKVTVTATVETATKTTEPTAKTTAAKTTAARTTTAAKKPAAKKPAAKKPAAKTSTAKATAAKKPAAKAPAKKATTQKAS
ncbi:MAG TPA: hypothetical protein VLB67_02220 [Acidimicrobiia bacterium]|nr:hypothetical protein [Acidimicrobiia bacterium]